MKRIILTALILIGTATPTHADTKYRKWNGMQTGEVVVCYGPSGAGTFAISRKSPKDGPTKWTTWTHCEQNAYGFRNGHWADWHDRRTGELLWCYGGVTIKRIEGARPGAEWAKCTSKNLGR